MAMLIGVGVPTIGCWQITATYRHETGCIYTAFAPVGGETLEFHLYLTDQGDTMTYYTAGVSGIMSRR